MASNERKIYDVLIIGSGASGGWVAKELAEAGMKVLMLEAGKKLPIEQELPLPGSLEHLRHLWEVARKGLARLRGQRDLAAVAAREAAEAVPLGFELPAFALRQLGGEQGFHRRGSVGLGHPCVNDSHGPAVQAR